MKMKFTFLILVIILPFFAISQTPVNLEWSKVYGGSSLEEPNDYENFRFKTSMDIDDAENLYIVTNSYSSDGDVGSNKGSTDVWVLKLNSKGDTLWTKTFGGTVDDFGTDIVTDGNGGCVIVGITLSDDGDFLNTGHHGLNDQEDGFVAILDKDGNIMRIKQYGSKSWQDTTSLGDTVHIGGRDRLNAVIKTKDGNYMAVGFSNSTDGDLTFDEDQYYASWFLKFDGNGKKISSQKFSGGFTPIEQYSFELIDLVQADDGDFVALGQITAPYNLDGTPYWIVKTSGLENNKKVWETKYSSASVLEYPYAIQKYGDGYVVTGRIAGETGGDVSVPGFGGFTDTWVFTTDKDGEMLNQNVFGGSFGDVPRDCIVRKNGNIVIAGRTSSEDFFAPGGNGSTDFWLLELDSKLDTLQMHKFGGSGADGLSCIKESKDGKAFYLAGISQADTGNSGYIPGNTGGDDIWVGKIAADPTLYVEEIENESNIKCIPTNDHGVFNLINANNKNIEIYDMLGKKVTAKRIQSDDTKLDISNVNAGIYILNFDDNTPALKLIVY